MSTHYFDKKVFVVEDYNRQKPFASFLPGVAGKKGIPLWCFYVNRAQGVSGFGLKDKSAPIMVFTPANKAYETVATTGFRTFFVVDGHYYEAFRVDSPHKHRMRIDKTSFSIEETNEKLGLRTTVKYFGLPSMPLAGLVRKVTVENISNREKDIEILDGIAEILPAGVHNAAFKGSSNLLQSWMDVNHLDKDLAFFKLRATTNDTSEVGDVVEGNFYFGSIDGKRIAPLVDQNVIFGENSAKTEPAAFLENGLASTIASEQAFSNKIPCAFLPLRKRLAAGESITFHAVSGHAKSIRLLEPRLESLTRPDNLKEKEIEAKDVVEGLLADVATETAHATFDEYIKQCYLDNFLRGGYPERIGKKTFHLFSRRHGDLERDYNFFHLAPEYYSQGSGNFRDVCQNRRLDTFIHTEVERFNIRYFASLIQLDGYNPLVIDGTTYGIDDKKTREEVARRHFKDNKQILELLRGPFTPGRIVHFVENDDVTILTDEESYLEDIMNHASPRIAAAFGEGYWIDHFSYVLDLIESFEGIYPDRMAELLYDDKSYAFFESPVSVKKKEEKSVTNAEGDIRQYKSLLHPDSEKIAKLNLDPKSANWAKIGDETYQTNLFTKLFTLVMNKHAQLDPAACGIEMEAEKPGWNDAMNGVPGLFGSGVGETVELLRIVRFLLAHRQEGFLDLPKEIAAFFGRLQDEKGYFDRVEAREAYRDSVRFGLSGEKKTFPLSALFDYLEGLKKDIEHSLGDLYEKHDGIIPTFFTYRVTDHAFVSEHGTDTGQNPAPVRPKSFEKRPLPPFLEAPARLLKAGFSSELLHDMHERILASDMYDQKLGMFKTSACLNGESHEIGRIRAFTKGWLERESNFLHMTYKYLLGLLHAGLHEEFFETMKKNLVCFMDPAVYGRSTLENSSFLATANNPDKGTHGRGFFARLSGSTIEALNMWTMMMVGKRPFRTEDGELVLRFTPVLEGSFFKTDGTASFTFRKKTTVTYVNPSRKNTYDEGRIERIVLERKGETITRQGDAIRGRLAEEARNGSFKRITAYIK